MSSFGGLGTELHYSVWLVFIHWFWLIQFSVCYAPLIGKGCSLRGGMKALYWVTVKWWNERKSGILDIHDVIFHLNLLNFFFKLGLGRTWTILCLTLHGFVLHWIKHNDEFIKGELKHFNVEIIHKAIKLRFLWMICSSMLITAQSVRWSACGRRHTGSILGFFLLYKIKKKFHCTLLWFSFYLLTSVPICIDISVQLLLS